MSCGFSKLAISRTLISRLPIRGILRHSYSGCRRVSAPANMLSLNELGAKKCAIRVRPDMMKTGTLGNSYNIRIIDP